MTATIKMLDCLTGHQSQKINHFWNELYPVNLNNLFELLLKDIKEFKHYLLLSETEEILGWAVAFSRDEETWFSILVSEGHQKKGLGKMLIKKLQEDYQTLSGWVIDHNNNLKRNGTMYQTPLQFYLQNNFLLADERIESDLISAVRVRFSR